jgi:hypothetical protein
MTTTTTTIGGRPAKVSDIGRVRQNIPGRRFYNLVSIKFLDTEEPAITMPAGKFAKWATAEDRKAKGSSK